MNSFFANHHCPVCGSVLVVRSIDRSKVHSFKGEDFYSTEYVCSGDEPHRWHDTMDKFQGRVMALGLFGPLDDLIGDER